MSDRTNLEIVTVTLTSINPREPLPVRTFDLVEGTTVPIARSSRSSSHDRDKPQSSNALIESPVISRSHAQLLVDDRQQVFLKDVGSMHGTWVNGCLLQPHRASRLNDLDTVSVGTDITIEGIGYERKSFQIHFEHCQSPIDLSSPPLSPQTSAASLTKVQPTTETSNTFVVPHLDDESHHSGSRYSSPIDLSSDRSDVASDDASDCSSGPASDVSNVSPGPIPAPDPEREKFLKEVERVIQSVSSEPAAPALRKGRFAQHRDEEREPERTDGKLMPEQPLRPSSEWVMNESIPAEADKITPLSLEQNRGETCNRASLRYNLLPPIRSPVQKGVTLRSGSQNEYNRHDNVNTAACHQLEPEGPNVEKQSSQASPADATLLPEPLASGDAKAQVPFIHQGCQSTPSYTTTQQSLPNEHKDTFTIGAPINQLPYTQWTLNTNEPHPFYPVHGIAEPPMSIAPPWKSSSTQLPTHRSWDHSPVHNHVDHSNQPNSVTLLDQENDNEKQATKPDRFENANNLPRQAKRSNDDKAPSKIPISSIVVHSEDQVEPKSAAKRKAHELQENISEESVQKPQELCNEQSLPAGQDENGQMSQDIEGREAPEPARKKVKFAESVEVGLAGLEIRKIASKSANAMSKRRVNGSSPFRDAAKYTAVMAAGGLLTFGGLLALPNSMFT